ncbi:hypothetical protein WG66_006323 [Moniliophthora roreri]|nr:hypothetical protein WG66_006323 [Moniliophthora roreri]
MSLKIYSDVDAELNSEPELRLASIPPPLRLTSPHPRSAQWVLAFLFTRFLHSPVNPGGNISRQNMNFLPLTTTALASSSIEMRI